MIFFKSNYWLYSVSIFTEFLKCNIESIGITIKINDTIISRENKLIIHLKIGNMRHNI